MAAIIDGVTHSGYWKITPDDSSPDSYYVIPKASIFIDASKLYLLTDPTGSTVNIGIDTTTKDHTGTALGSIAAIANYLETYR